MTQNVNFSMADDWEAPVTAQQILKKHLDSGNKEMSQENLIRYIAAVRNENNMSRQPRMTMNQLTPMRNLRRR